MASIDGVTVLETDTTKNICRFKVPKEISDLKERLDELAKDNQHLAEYSFKKN